MVGGTALAPHDVQATFCATVVDEWARRGARHAVIAPGSRSTPMALAIADHPDLAVHVVHDERVAAFTALGLGVDGVPALLLCTSGTAAANFYPAVVEAGLSHVPMLVLTADRPGELRGVGAPQTIDQLELYGRHVRWFADAEVADPTSADTWRPLAAAAWVASASGPAHLNLPFREPLLGAAGELPPPIAPVPSPGGDDGPVDALPAGFDRQRGVILAGGSSGVDAADVVALHELTGWPILADPTSALRRAPGAVTTADSLLRHAGFAADHAPEVVVRVGRPAASKVLAEWTARDDLLLVQIGGPGRIDPAHNVAAVCSIGQLLDAEPAGATGTTWLARWTHAERRADQAIRATLASFGELTEPGVARLVANHLPEGAVLTVASSMPVRDLEWFGGAAARAHANRGANGIDGVVSTALGRALGGRDAGSRASVALVGDLAFTHDSNALVALAGRGADLRVVVIDNDGGGIFSFLPQATELPADRYEQLFGTPLGADLIGLARAHRIDATTVTSAEELVAHLARPGPWVARVRSDRARNVEVHRALHAAVAAALN